MAVIRIFPTPPVPFVIDLQAIDGRRIGLFDASGKYEDATGVITSDLVRVALE